MTFFQKSNYVLIAIALLLVNHLQAQCYSWEAHPQNIQTAKEQHQRYRDLFRAKKYKEAFPVWKKLFRHVQSPKEVPIRHFKDGIKMYKVFAKTEKDKESKLEYIDTIVNLYNQLARCVGEKSLDRAWQGYSIYFLEGEAQMAIEAFEKSIDLGGDSTHSMVLLPITRLSIYLYKKKHPHFTKQYLSQLYYKLKSIADYNIVNNHKKGTVYKEKWDKAYLEFFALRDSLNTIWDCKYYENQWKLKCLADSNNIEQNKQILKGINKKCGELSDFYNRVKNNQDNCLLNTCAGALIHELSVFEQAKWLERKSLLFLRKGDSLLYEKYWSKSMSLYQQVLSEIDTAMTNLERASLYYRFAYKAYKKRTM